MNADAVLAGAVGKLDTENLSGSGEEVGQAMGLLGCCAGLHMAGPADEKGNAVAAFVNVSFVTAEDVAGVVALGNKLFKLGLGGAAVVAGDNEKRVFGKSLLIEGGEEFAEGGVRMHDKVGVGVEAAF